MKKRLKYAIALSMGAALTLTACQQFSGLPTGDQQDSNQNEATQQLSENYYQAVIEDNRYTGNDTRGLIAGTTSQANMKNMEKGLYELAQGVFPTDEFLLREGQVITADQANEWLGAQSDDNPKGLNPKGYHADNRDQFEPRYLNSILEYNLMERNDEGKLSLKGISIALAMNESDIFSTDDQEETVTIDRKTQLEKGKEMAKEVVSRIRQDEKYNDIPIQVAIFANAASDDIGGGTFITESMVSQGDQFGEWMDYQSDYVVYGVDSAPSEDDSASFAEFQTDVESLFPQLSGITGVGHYVDNKLERIDISINSQFDGYTETVVLTQKAIDSATNLFNKNLEINIEILSPSGTRAILSRPSGADHFNYTVL